MRRKVLPLAFQFLASAAVVQSEVGCGGTPRTRFRDARAVFGQVLEAEEIPGLYQASG
jgi:hypothetical protein